MTLSPGNWHIQTSDPNDFGFGRVYAGKELIFQNMLSRTQPEDAQTILDNSLAIAAIPELLEACHEAKLALHSLNSLRRTSESDRVYAYDKVITALKKAQPNGR